MRFLLSSLLLFLSITVGASPGAPKPPKDFVTPKGASFQLNGKPFAFVGANSYARWLPLLQRQDDIEATFKEMQGAGIKVLRTWGFNAINGSELADAKKSGLTYYQVWNSTEWVLNDGAQGLQRLDNIIETAGKYGIKVILAFTNNWVGYGGSELYINWIAGAGKTHDVFYSDPRIVASYRMSLTYLMHHSYIALERYVKTIVNRYKNSANVFAWELMNEARCLGDLPSSSACPRTGLLHDWYKQQAAFVRKLDPNHLITTGGEGHFFWKKSIGYWLNGQFISDYNFNGDAGEDFDGDLALDNIDFGTYHLYPQFWYGNLDTPDRTNFSIKSWGLDWIKAHADAAKKANKPVILEEFGVFGLQNKTEIYPEWVNIALDTKHGWIMPWQFGKLGLKEDGGNRLIKYADALIDGASPNDGFTYYKNQTAVWNVFTNAAKVQAARSK
ncbi:glycoside hydrolase [Crucibulum laeve]|uniref:mannan endo-1,4-beta-mannosidase n=1 Tax=Crucibulum laeve TaxID=68775 RepID=A0A5C3MIQ5_9AGAR|nr:glycoside hydrolase [Crucibulum laeve]